MKISSISSFGYAPKNINFGKIRNKETEDRLKKDVYESSKGSPWYDVYREQYGLMAQCPYIDFYLKDGKVKAELVKDDRFTQGEVGEIINFNFQYMEEDGIFDDASDEKHAMYIADTIANVNERIRFIHLDPDQQNDEIERKRQQMIADSERRQAEDKQESINEANNRAVFDAW